MAENIYDNVVLLNGIVLENEVEIFPGIRLVPFPSTLGKKRKEIPRYVSEFSSAVGINYFFHKTQFIISSSASSEFDGKQFLQSLSLACNSGIQIAASIQMRMDEEPFSMVPYAGSTVTYMQHDPVKDSDIEEAKCIYELLCSLEPDVRRKLQIPIDRWIKSHIKQCAIVDRIIDSEIPPEDIATSPTISDVDKMIDLGIAFEAQYLSGRKKLSLKFRKRASWFLNKNAAHQKKLKEKFEKVYDLRCDAVHEGKLPQDVEICGKFVPISEFIKQTQNLCRQSILKIVKNGQFPDWAKIHIPE